MRNQESRIFVYTPNDPSPRTAPEPDPVDRVRSRLLSPVAAISVWVLVGGLSAPAMLLLILLLPENYAQLLFGFGLWLVLGLTIFHWWMPAAQEERPNWEGLAIAGWHVLLSLILSAVIAWVFLFSGENGLAFTLGELPPVIILSGVIVVLLGMGLTIIRGYRPGQALRYAWTFTCLLGAWMALWLVAAHSGL